MSLGELSAEQRQAVYAPGHLRVRASAGSGKTEVLARRFVALVAGDVEGFAPVMPDRIAAVTFTEKAAFDMKSRIGRVFDARLEVARQDAARERGRLDHLVKARQRLALARVSTIHSFCSRLLRENPLEAGVDPDFEVLDEYESGTLIERCCEELLLEALRSRNPAAIWLIEARGLRGHELRPGAVPLLVRLLSELHLFGRDCAWLEAATRLTGDQVELDEHCFARENAKLISLVETIASTSVSARSADAGKLAELARAWNDWLRDALECSTRNRSPQLLTVWKRLCEFLPSARPGALSESVAQLRKLVGPSKSGIGLTGSLVGLYGAYRAKGRALGVAQLLQAIALGISERKKFDNVVTFDDLLSLTLKLLRFHPAVARRYRASLDALLVDEFQDTDRIQDSVVVALTEGSDHEHSPQLFLVGDEKQSIYGFRGADVTLFNRAREPTCETITLNENRRSVPNLIKFANLVGESVMRPEDACDEGFNTIWNKSHELRPLRDSIDEPSVELMLSGAEGASLGKSARRIVEANAIATHLRTLIEDGASTIEAATGQRRPLRYSDIAIVMRSMVDVATYQRALAGAGVPNYVVKGRGFFDSQEIRDVVNLLAAVDAPDNTIALAAALRSPLFGLSDRCLFALVAQKSPEVRDLGKLFANGSSRFEWLELERDAALKALGTLRELRVLRGHASLVEVLERALELTDFEVVLAGQTAGRQMVANLRKLVAIAREFDQRGYFGFCDFVRHLGGLVASEPLEPQAQILGEAENVVRLMTIHQAKGLEFPVVFLADVGRQAPNAENDYLISDRQGLLLRETVGSGQLEIPNYLLTEEIARRKRRAQAEATRLLYVAITRARDRLVVSDLAERGGWANQLRRILDPMVLDSFITSPAATQQITRGAARLLLRRIEPLTAPRHQVVAARARDALEPEGLIARRLSYAEAAPSELVISPTALAEFESCPLRYRWRYQLTIPEEISTGSSGGSWSDASRSAALGLVAHSILERVDHQADTSIVESQIDQLLEDRALVADLAPQDRLSIRKDLIAYIKIRDPAESIIGNELPFFTHLSDATLTLYLRGRIDLLVATKCGPKVRDYKYSEYRPANLDTYELQLESYKLAASQALETDVSCELVFLKNRPRLLPIELGSNADIRKHLLAVGHELAVAIQTEKFQKKPKSPTQCRQIGCGYVVRCWHGREGSEAGTGSR